ncbi:MAG: alpha/beta fold hydrolase [Ramlibacter sp.]
MSMTPTTAVDAAATFYRPGPGLRLARSALAAAQRLWPTLAVRAAARLFGTPLPPRWLQRPVRWAAPWQSERWPFEDAALTIHLHAAPADAPLALLVHGWGGQARQLLPLADTLAQQGLRPVLLEMPAHGGTAGSTSNLPQFARAIDYALARLQQRGHRVELLAAHSLGASAAAQAASRGAAIGRLVLLAPPASPRAYTQSFARAFGLSEATRAAMQQVIEAREGVLMQQFEPGAVGARVRVPTLVVHDRGDRVNAFADGQAFAQAIRDARLLATDGLGHRKLLQDPVVLARVAQFAMH